MAQQKTALIVGMAKSGIAAARLLYENGYRGAHISEATKEADLIETKAFN